MSRLANHDDRLANHDDRLANHDDRLARRAFRPRFWLGGEPLVAARR